MLISKFFFDVKTYISINYANPKRFPKSKLESYIPRGLQVNKLVSVKSGVSFSDKLICIGRGSYIGNNTTILNCSRIGNYCSISHDVKIGLDNHDLNGLSTSPLICKMKPASPTIIEHDVLISANVVILSGVTLGTGCVIGANSFVNCDIPPYSIAVGSPAKVIKHRFNKKTVDSLLTSKWWEKEREEINANLDLYNKLIEDDDASQ